MVPFNPSRPYVLTSMRSGGISGKVSSLTIRKDGKKYAATIGNYSMNTPVGVSDKNARLLEGALKRMDWSSLPDEDGSSGYDLFIWSVLLVQDSHEWRFKIRSERASQYHLDALQFVLNGIVQGTNTL